MAKKPKKVLAKEINGGELDWDESDFRFVYPKSDPRITPASFGIYPTQAGLAAQMASVMPTTLPAATASLGIPSNTQVNPATATSPLAPGSDTVSGVSGVAGSQPASAFLAPAQQAPVKEYLDNPELLETSSPMDAAKSWLSNLFDYEDEEKENPVETVWDGLLFGLDWGYDRLNQLTSAGISGLPGGINTLTWDEAGQVSVGQAFVGSMGAAAGRMKRGEMEAGDWLTLPGTLLSTGLSMIDPENEAQQEGFDITDAQQRAEAFDAGAGKWSAGLLDAAFVIFGDPLIFGGKVAKVTRLRYLDQPISSKADLDRITRNLDEGGATVNDYRIGKVTTAGGDIDQFRRLAPEAQLAAWVSQKAEDGSKFVTRSEIYNHRVVKYATNREGLTAALYNAENYDEAALIIRAAAGDIDAQAGLMQIRADIAVEIGDARRKLNFAKFASNPAVKKKMEDKAAKTANAAAERLSFIINKHGGLKNARSTDEYMRAKAQLDQANETYVFTANLDESMIDPLNVSNLTSPEAIQVARDAVRQMTQRDKYFTNAFANEQTRVNSVFGSLRESTRGFSRNNAFGRRVEASRQSRATAAYEAAATRGARRVDAQGNVKRLKPWESDVFGNNGLTRALRLWRFMGEEAPSGFVTTRGIGAQESAREVRAVLNDIPIYSGETRTVTITKMKKAKGERRWTAVLDEAGNPVKESVIVGGAQRKEELLGRYIDALNDSTRGDMAAKLALDEIEEQITKDIAAWHGMDRATAEGVLRTAQGKRDKIVDNIVNEGYWVDEGVGGKPGDVNKSPWLETHLQNGTYMLNFKAFEKRAALYEETGWIKSADTAKQAIGEKMLNGYEFFNEIWRPAVLLRLGYTQRNVAEGLFRASAFQFSLAPLQYAASQGAYSLRNAWVKRTMRGATEEATVAARKARAGMTFDNLSAATKTSIDDRVREFADTPKATGKKPKATEVDSYRQRLVNEEIAKAPVDMSGVVLPKKYYKWKAKQIAARDKDIADNVVTISESAKLIAPYNPAFRDEMLDFWRAEANSALDDLVDLKNAGASADEIAVAQGRMDAANQQIDEFRKIKPIDDMTDEMAVVMDRVRYFRQVLDDSRAQRAILDNDVQGVALFRQQGIAKRRVFDGSYSGPDFITYQQAFDENSPYTPIALMNSSADNTTKSMASLRMDTMENALRAVTMRHYVNVAPDQPEYWDGVARAVRQFKNSEIGAMILNDATDEDILTFLRTTQEGREVAAFVTRAQIPQNGTKGLKAIDPDDAMEYIQEVRRRADQLMPTQEFRDYIKATDLNTFNEGQTFWRGKPIESGFTGKVVEMFLGQKDANGKFLLDLKPVVGNIAEETGFKSVREHWARIANTGMKWLGTFPENAFVRVPFYGRRYRDTMDNLIASIQEQQGSKYISTKELDQLQSLAHRRALKDTKDWLYTIERRTKLGAIGEYAFPFISAAQNSVTTVGRLIWNDPSIAAIVAAIWKTPQALGIEDENGNIVIPIPHDLIPDGIEQALGFDNMRNWKIDKTRLNVVMPETGFGLIPRPGPLVAVPVSEFMKKGWFGQTVEAPQLLKGILGDKEAQQVWDVWKSYVFGEGQGLSPEFLSFDLLLPPVAARVLQMIQGEGSSRQYAYYYNLQMRSEMAKYIAGYRDTKPTADEIKQRTNGFYMMRIVANLTAFTPPQYETNLDPLINTIRAYDQEYGLDGARMANENLGNLLMMLGDFSNSKNIAGMMPHAQSVEAARKYSNIIKDLAPGFEQNGDLSVLSMLVNNDPNAFYDDSAYAWQFSAQIPGVTDYFREFQTPEMAWAESQKNAGWTEFISRMDVIDSLLQQAGLTSYRSAAATKYREMKNATIEEMANNPLYAAWYQDYKDFGSTRTFNAVRLMERALSDEQFVADQMNDDEAVNTVWEAASYYLQQRNMVLEAVRASGKGINADGNEQIRDYWDEQRQMLVNQVDGWGTFANRFLNGDDDPESPGVQFGVVYEMDGAE